MEKRIALFPGTFDPFTVGHLSVVERAAGLFDSVIIAIGINGRKTPMFPLEKRREDIRKAVAHLPNVEVADYTGLTVDACRQFDARFIVRGIRSVADFEYERNLADINRRISGVETVLLYSLPEYESVNSSTVRELAAFGADTSQFLP